MPPDYLALYQKWGAAYHVPWQLLAAVGSVESRHGRDPGAYVPHTRGVLGPMQFQAGSNKAAKRVDAAGDQGFGGTWGIYRKASGPSALPHGRRRRRDRGGRGEDRLRRRQRAALAACAVALQRAPLVPQDGAPARRALRHELGLRPAASSPSRRRSRRPPRRRPAAASSALAARGARRLGAALAATPESLLATDAIAFAPAAADDISHGVADQRLVSLLAWIAQRHHIVVTIIRTGHAKYVGGTHKVSNHWYGRAATISEVDGEAVTAGSHAVGKCSGTSCRRRLRRDPPGRDRLALGEPRRTPAIFTGPDEKATIHVGFDAAGAKA